MESFFSSLKVERIMRNSVSRTRTRPEQMLRIHQVASQCDPALDDQKYESCGVREAGWIGLSWGQLNRVQATLMVH
jgi:hypothetical protein